MRFKRVKLREGVIVLNCKENAANRKSAIFLAICLHIWKKCSTFAPESCEFSFIRTRGAHPDKAIRRGWSFLLVVSFYCFFNAIIRR